MLCVLAAALTASLAGDPAFDEGLRLYKSLEYEQAIFRFEEVAVRPALEPADKALVLMWLGLSYAGTGDLDSAKRDLRHALVVDDAIALPPDTSPRVAALFEELRADVKKEKSAVETPPPPPPPPPAKGDAGFPLFIGGVTGVGIGAVSLVAGGVLTWVAFDQLEKAKDHNSFQSEAKNALDTANGAGVSAAILIPLGVVVGAGGGVLIALAPE